jgi:hypothetical protein
MPGQHDSTPIQTVIYKPNEHADEYIVAIDDVAEVSGHLSSLSSPSLVLLTLLLLEERVRANIQYEQWKTDKSIALSRFVGQFAIVSRPRLDLSSNR